MCFCVQHLDPNAFKFRSAFKGARYASEFWIGAFGCVLKLLCGSARRLRAFDAE